MDLLKKLINAGIEESEAKKEISILESEIKDKEKIKKIIDERVKTRTPIQYLLGKAYFMDFEVKVNNKVLIPRPETEILVEETVKKLVIARNAVTKQSSVDSHKKIASSVLFRPGGPVLWRAEPPRNDITALDIGTGSGVIAIALAKMIPNIKITAIDLDKEIIDLASESARLNNVGEKINFKVCDVFSKCFEELIQSQEFDLIISNPPYVTGGPHHSKLIKPEVMHEPEIALYGSKENKTGLVYYERIVELCRRRGRAPSPTMMVFEIDPPLVKSLKALMEKHGLNNFEIVQDYYRLDRCLFIFR